MLRKLFLVICALFLCLAVTRSVSAQELLSAQNAQVLVSYKNGQSPQELTTKLATEKKNAATLVGRLQTQIAHVLGQVTMVEKLETQLSSVTTAEKKAGVISSQKVDAIESTSPSVYTLTLKSGTDITSAIRQLKKLPEVKSVLPNFMLKSQTRGGSSIQSVEEVPSTVQYIVQYKKDQAPEQLQNKVDSRTGLIGQVARIADNMSSGTTSAESQLNKVRQTWNKLDYVYSTNVYPASAQSNSLLENTQVVTFENTSDANEVISAYKKLPNVEAIMPNFATYTNVIPNDPYYSNLWGMTKVQAPAAWDTTKGSNDVIVAVLDSGVDYNHPDLAGAVIRGTDFSTCDDTAEDQAHVQPGSCLHPKQPDDNPMDDAGHGTHVAGTIGAIGNNEVGVAGINWRVKILAVKIMGAGGVGFVSSTLSGIAYATEHGAKVINMSLGVDISPYSCSSNDADLGIIQNAIRNARDAGVAIIVSAGNDNIDARTDLYASCPGVLAVGASTQTDTRASFSNYGSVVRIAAPGVQILSTVPGTIAPGLAAGCPAFPANSSYRYCSGTSMATPMVAGAAGLLLSVNSGLNPTQIEDLLIQNADPISTDRSIGPRLNLAKAIQAAAGEQPGTTPTPTGEEETPSPTEAEPTEETTPSPTLEESSGLLKISLILPGIGGNGNTDPKEKMKTITVDFIGADGQSVKKETGTVSYEQGQYKGNIPVEDVPAETYQIKIKLDNTLSRLIPGFYTISDNQSTTINTPLVTLTPGDVNQDGVLDLLDYNLLVFSCVKDWNRCNGSNLSKLADFNSDGIVNEKDLNIFLRQLEERNGD